MGYPASGLEGFYRNRREDAQKFLNHRHGKNFWVFNFCPVKENSYPASVFDGRVSRYPFPDHQCVELCLYHYGLLVDLGLVLHLWRYFRWQHARCGPGLMDPPNA